jgi:hypothetical protein
MLNLRESEVPPVNHESLRRLGYPSILIIYKIIYDITNLLVQIVTINYYEFE